MNDDTPAGLGLKPSFTQSLGSLLKHVVNFELIRQVAYQVSYVGYENLEGSINKGEHIRC